MDQAMKLPFKVSTTTSNFMIGVTAAASAGIYLARGYIDPGIAFPVMLGVLAGSLIGTRILVRARVGALKKLFAFVSDCSGLRDDLQRYDGKNLMRDLRITKSTFRCRHVALWCDVAAIVAASRRRVVFATPGSAIPDYSHFTRRTDHFKLFLEYANGASFISSPDNIIQFGYGPSDRDSGCTRCVLHYWICKTERPLVCSDQLDRLTGLVIQFDQRCSLCVATERRCGSRA